MIEDGLLQTIDPSLVSTKVNRAYRLHRDAIAKNYQAHKKAAWAVVLGRRTLFQRDVGNRVDTSQIT